MSSSANASPLAIHSARSTAISNCSFFCFSFSSSCSSSYFFCSAAAFAFRPAALAASIFRADATVEAADFLEVTDLPASDAWTDLASSAVLTYSNFPPTCGCPSSIILFAIASSFRTSRSLSCRTGFKPLESSPLNSNAFRRSDTDIFSILASMTVNGCE